MKILITGTPGVGKTTLAEKISMMKGIEHIELTKFIKENDLYESYDAEFDTLIFDEEFVMEKLDEYLNDKKSYIIDTHSPSIAKNCDFNYILHLVVPTDILFDRLLARNYNQEKIDENIQCEIFNVIGEELSGLFEQEAFLINASDAVMDETEMNITELLEEI